MFAVYQAGYDVLGVGRTLTDAIEDAHRWLCEPITAGEVIRSRGRCELSGHLYWAPCSERLAKTVRRKRGKIAYSHTESGTIDLAEETVA